MDGLELYANDGSLDGEVDGRAVGTLLVADEGVMDELGLDDNDGSLVGLHLMMMMGRLMEK